MTELNCDIAVAQAIALIESYSFDTNGNSAEKLVQKWLHNYQESWVRLAAIEALYLGRYKTVSIEQIMAVWLRIGTPNIHFKGEFERLICRKLPKHLVIANSFWFKTEEYPVSTSLKEHLNSAHSQSSQFSDLLTKESSPQAEPVTPENNLPHRFSDVKNIFKPTTNLDIYNSPTITNFNPIIDNSAFFQKLKSLALNLD